MTESLSYLTKELERWFDSASEIKRDLRNIITAMGDAAIRKDAGVGVPGTEAEIPATSPQSPGTLNREALAIAYEAYSKAAAYRPISSEYLAEAIKAYLHVTQGEIPGNASLIEGAQIEVIADSTIQKRV